MECFGFFIDLIMKMPLEMARAFPKFNRVIGMTVEEIAKVRQDSSWLNLEGMDRGVKNSFDHMDRISDNDDFGNIIDACSLINTTSNGK